MARLPDRFDLWLRRARACPDPARQADYVLGALAALPAWYFLDVGRDDAPRAAEVDLPDEAGRALLVFSDTDRIAELGPEARAITLPPAEAMAWCAGLSSAALLVNPGEDSAVIPLAVLADFHRAWLARQEEHPSGYWIPSLTTEEEDFWQEHGL
jgi:hypothetical protein